jgi:hypothetical protein
MKGVVPDLRAQLVQHPLMVRNAAASSMTTPIRLTDLQLTQVMRLARPLSVNVRAAFLERLASELRVLGELDDGVVFRTASRIQREFFDPPDPSEWSV